MARPSGYKPEFAKQAAKLCLLGATDTELAKFFGVSQRTIDRWKSEHAEFCRSLKAGKKEADERVERSLYQRASGYSHESEKIFCSDGQVTRAKTIEHYPPDTTACIFWLKNRRPDLWRDAKDLNVNGAIAVKHLGLPEVRERTEFLISRGADATTPVALLQ